jgi:hypothetical protein
MIGPIAAGTSRRWRAGSAQHSGRFCDGKSVSSENR